MGGGQEIGETGVGVRGYRVVGLGWGRGVGKAGWEGHGDTFCTQQNTPSTHTITYTSTYMGKGRGSRIQGSH